MVRKRNHATGAQPFDTLAVADIGDVAVCLYDIKFVLQLLLYRGRHFLLYHDFRPRFCRHIGKPETEIT